MRLLFTGLLPPHLGGAALRDAQLLQMLAHRGHEVIALAPAWPGMDDAADRLAPAIALHRFAMPEPYLGPWVYCRASFRDRHAELVGSHLSRLVEDHAPDLVAVGGELFLAGIPDLAARLGRPWVVLAHGLPPRRQLDELELLDGMARADLVVCCAHHLARWYAGAGLDRVIAIPNAVDTDRFGPMQASPEKRRALGTSHAAPVVLHVSNLTPRKRPLDLVRSAAAVVAPRPEIVYVVVGAGSERAELEQACRELGIDGRFRFLGRIDRASLPDYYALADMMVLPSEAEGMSLVCLEAMACGRLVIAADIPAMREIIRDGGSGLLFRLGDVEELAARTLRAAGDPELRARIGRAARAHVERHHRLDDMVARYEAVLADLVG